MTNRNLTLGELSDRAVDNTMNNREFMNFAAERKSQDWSGGQSSQSLQPSQSSQPSQASGWSQVGSPDIFEMGKSCQESSP